MAEFADNGSPAIQLLISYRGKKLNYSYGLTAPETMSTTIADLKQRISSDTGAATTTTSTNHLHIKLVKAGKMLANSLSISAAFSDKPKHKLMAMGMSQREIEEFTEAEKALRKATGGIRDDMTPEGRIEAARRILAGKSLNQKQASSSKTGFGRMETLPMLPDRDTAESILRSLMEDPGVQACMASRGWFVPVLAEMYPEGKVGVSEVCVMGLNVNKGQKILLRLRTDDLRGFRKIASIRKVLFHELTHNEISEHDDSFFRLMRIVEKECTEMNWQRGGGSSTGFGADVDMEAELAPEVAMLRKNKGYIGGTNRLGGDSAALTHLVSAREMAGSAAVQRLSQEEKEVIQNCGCGDSSFDHLGVATATAATTMQTVKYGLYAVGEHVQYKAKKSGKGIGEAGGEGGGVTSGAAEELKRSLVDEMGFDEATAERGVREGGGTLEGAIEWISAHQDEEEKAAAEAEEEWIEATVKTVHLENGVEDPYYTISFGEGKEKQTIASRLRRPNN
jgi:hypothetical protein